MTDAVEKIESLQQPVRLLEQRLQNAERAIEDRDQTIEGQKHDLESRRQHAMEVGEYERPEVVAQILEHSLRGWPRERWQALATYDRQWAKSDLRRASPAQIRASFQGVEAGKWQ